MLFKTLLGLSAIKAGVLALAPSGPWDKFNIAPKTRTLYATAVKQVSGYGISGTNSLLNGGDSSWATLSGNGSWVALDFGLEVGGLITLSLSSSTPLAPTHQSTNSTTTPFAPNYDALFRMAFTESPLFIGPISDDSTLGVPEQNYDMSFGVSYPPQFNASSTSSETGTWTFNNEDGSWTYTQPKKYLRGGFRYLTLVASPGESIEIRNVSVAISFEPGKDDLSLYEGYFYSEEEELLNRIWYAGGYTVQTNIVEVDTGRQIPIVSRPGWANNGSLGVGEPIIVDGAKRDRAVWPGDMGIAVPSGFVSTGDLTSVRNALATMFAYQLATGAFPESGPPLLQLESDTYHMWTMIGFYNHYLYTDNTTFLAEHWHNYTRAANYMSAKVDPSVGLMNVTGLRDWARLGGGGFNSEGNAIYYKMLVNSAILATAMNDSALATSYSNNATALYTRFNDYFWNDALGGYVDNSTTTLLPQDANSLALLYGLANTTQGKSVSAYLKTNWNEFGSVAPELPLTICPFIGGLELQGHFESGNDDHAMELMRLEWGFMVNTNISVQSTLLEGYASNGTLDYRSYRGYGYDSAYTSHAHGWSSGATSALTNYLLGLDVTSPAGATWSLNPHPSNLTVIQGGFSTSLGRFDAKWKISSAGNWHFNISSPNGTLGTVSIPSRYGELWTARVGQTKVAGVPVAAGRFGISVVGTGRSVIVKFNK